MTYDELYELIENTLTKATSTDVAWNIKYSEPSAEEEILEVHLLVGNEIIQETYKTTFRTGTCSTRNRIYRSRKIATQDHR